MSERGYDRLKEILCSDFILLSIENNLEELFKMIPELKEMVNFDQNNPAHNLNLWDHTLYALYLSSNDFETRLALLLHDLGKLTCNFLGTDGFLHYKGHPKESYNRSIDILKRLNLSEEEIERVLYLILYHDSEITLEDINKVDIKLLLKRFEMQCCDTYAHHPSHIKKREVYLDSIRKKLDLKCC